jgi:hypothetical protein
MAVTQLSDLSSLYNTIYDASLFVARERNLMLNLVDVRDAQGWMSRIVPIRAQITAAAVAETEDYSNPSTFGKSTKATITPSEIIAQAVLTDINMETDPDNAVRDLAVELGSAVAYKIDYDLVSLFTSFTTDVGAGAGSSASLTTLGDAVARLNATHALQYGQPVAVLHPYHWHDIWVELGVPAATYANKDAMTTEALRNYFAAELMGVRIFTSGNIAVDGSDDAISGIFVQPAIMADFRRRPRLESQRDASARATEWNLTAGYGVGVVRADFGMKYTADATAP